MKDTILVTGATGTVGSEVIKALASADVKVRAGVHSIIKGDRFKSLPNVELVQIDFDNPETLKVALTGVAKVFLLTPFSLNQVAAARMIIDEAKQTGVKHIVRLSAKGADAEPGIQLGRWHREVEVYLEHSGIPYTILRSASFMQNFSNYSGHTIQNEDKIYLPLGAGKVGYIDVRDIAAVAKEVLIQAGHENKIYDLTGPEAVSVGEVAQALTQACDRVITYVDVPEEASVLAMNQLPIPEWKIKALIELYSISKAGYAGQVTDTFEQLTKCKPRSVSDFASDYVQSFLPA